MGMRVSRHVQAIISAAYNEAKMRHHEYLTPEHLLYAALNFDVVSDILAACGANVAQIKNGMENFFEQKVPLIDNEPTQSAGFHSVLERAVMTSRSSQRETLDIADILVSLFDEEQNFCSYYMRKSGVTRLRLLKTLSHGNEAVKEFANEEQDGAQGDKIDAEDGGKQKKRSALDRFATDLTALAREGKLEPVIGRELELDRTIQVLCRRLKNNPVHVGDAGVGKTAITEGLAQRIAGGDVPPVLRDAQVFSLDMGAMIAGTRYRGDFEARMKLVVEEIMKKDHSILFIDEIHTVVGTGSASGAMDASNLLKPALTTGKLRCIGSTTHEEYNKFFEKDRALARRFQKIDIPEPDVAGAIKILKGLKPKYEEFHKVRFTDNALETAVKLSAQYINERRLPDKAIDVIDEAGAFARIGAWKTLDTENATTAEAAGLQEAKTGNTAGADSGHKVHRNLNNPQEYTSECWVDGFSETADNEKKPDFHSKKTAGTESLQEAAYIEIDTPQIETVIARIARIPEKSVGENEREKLRYLDEKLKTRVFGQDEAVAAVVKAVKRSRAGFRDPSKPVANFLFAGPTGVGKTELSRSLADLLGLKLHRFDMSEYQEKHTISRLIGSPPGYVGYEEGGLLTEAARKNPHCVLLLDEIEKAHPDIYNILLQIMDYATLTDNNGRKADFRNAVVIMTSNAGARDIGKNLIGFGERVIEGSTAVNDAVEKFFTPEFRGRLDAVVRFAHLTDEIMESIVEKELDDFKAQLKEKNVTIRTKTSCIKQLAKDAYSKESGARNSSRVIEEKIKSFFVDEVLFGSLSKGGEVELNYSGGKYQFKIKNLSRKAAVV
ncbi:ATP-dependent Clp protease ATP-binding subunit ClpC [Spirochaetia bacterium]|nr:ATP-dependent Clp protease ATP-binding subunit ClpC [Spirochaetia bacterium]